MTSRFPSTGGRYLSFWTYVLCLSGHALSEEPSGNVAYWTFPRANLYGDGIYINGGDLWINSTGAYGPELFVPDGNGPLWKLDLSLPYSTFEDLSVLRLLQMDGPAGNSSPYYVGGAMFANYNGLMTYGGMSSINTTEASGGMHFYTDIGSPKAINDSILEQSPPIGNDPWVWFRCCGADVSAPNENQAFYFGGLTALTRIAIDYDVSAGDPDQANTPSSDLIICDTTVLAKPVCERLPAPPGVEPRAESELIWVPYGAQGSLISMGGILIPADLSITGLNPTYNSSNNTNFYMTDILVYDIESGIWASQQIDRTSPLNPGPLASFCSVVATAQDGKSHHIYVYGGYDGTYTTPTAYDAVWVLSLPAFRWTKLTDGIPSHRRQNHKCIKISPSQFFSIGGNMEVAQPLLSSYIDVFNMSSGAWTSYDPKDWSEYVVPEAVQLNVPDLNAIPANLVSSVAKLMATPYTGPAVKKLGPYGESTLTETTKRLRASWWWLAAVVVDLAYLSLASCALIIVIILRRRMAYRAAKIDMSDMSSKNQIVRWMHNAPTKTVESMEETKTLQSPKHYSDSLSKSYVDEERIEYSAAPGQKKTSGTKVTTYERLNVDSVDDIELTSFTESSHPRTL